jgi:hypothetical protein
MTRVTILLLFSLLACSSRREGSAPGRGELVAEWSDSGRAVRIVAPAQATWCARDTMIELLAFRADTAFGLAIYPRDSLRAEGYPVSIAGIFAPWRPQATAALRVVNPLALLGYESTGGRVLVESGGGRALSGTFAVTVKQQQSGDTLQVTGSFTGVPIRPAAASCGRAGKPASG